MNMNMKHDGLFAQSSTLSIEQSGAAPAFKFRSFKIAYIVSLFRQYSDL